MKIPSPEARAVIVVFIFVIAYTIYVSFFLHG
jgi:hypothetical protein